MLWTWFLSLGVSIDPAARVVRFDQPDLPLFIASLTLRHLSLGDAWVSMLIRRTPGKMSVSVIERVGDIRVATTAWGRQNVSIKIQTVKHIARLEVHPDCAIPLCLVTNEFVTNSLRCTFGDG